MPIYAYRCEACGFAKDVLQKISDTPLSVCPSCNKAAFKKQLTAAGFQLKGTGWYATDFRSSNNAKSPPETPPTEKAPSDTTPAASPAASSPDAPSNATPAV